MTAYSETSEHRLYRDADRAVLGGVCAGLAGYFGLNLKVTRLLAFIAFLMAMPFAIVGYLAAVFLIPAASKRGHRIVTETGSSWGMRTSRRSRRSRRSRTARESDLARERTAGRAGSSVKDVRERYQALDKRLAELEKKVTSPRFQLEQEFRKL
ncbi:MAG: PspC domain-containing protein [Gammaproteobacteria bacterium]|nr:PspC domain-containing protein [Gammaproteobacteria bacterium]NND46066.1 PspC domain-containing protein [Woeseiaceae bacterium]NNL46005.1 PspC domain-containing protein [Woeseiaceae bacterium]